MTETQELKEKIEEENLYIAEHPHNVFNILIMPWKTSEIAFFPLKGLQMKNSQTL